MALYITIEIGGVPIGTYKIPAHAIRQAPHRCWEVLELNPGASIRSVKSAYRRLALVHHPDRGGSEEAFKSLQAAYEVALRLASQ